MTGNMVNPHKRILTDETFCPTHVCDTATCGCTIIKSPVHFRPVAGNTPPLETQVGGDHYKKYKIQPIQYSMANGLDACQHSIIKYVTRFRDKGGLQDLEKAKHFLELLIDHERQKPPGAL